MRFPLLFFAILLLATLLAAPIRAQDTVTASPADTSYQNNTIFLPAISSSPETSLLFGGVIIMQFKPKSAGADTRASSLLVSALYTLNQQILLSANPYLVTPGEEWILEGSYGFNYFPESFWGIGPDSRDSDEIRMEYREIFFRQSAIKKIRPGLFLGPQLRWTKTYDLDFEDTDGNSLPPPAVQGARGFTSAGVGFIARLDRRNSTITPTENYYVDLSIMANPEWLGTSTGYTSWQLDMRRYLDFSEGDGKTVLALQAITRLTSGAPPFKDMAILGGEVVLRGYYAGRYRDLNGAQIQAELRQHIAGRFGFTVFAASGEVWRRFEDFALDNAKWSAGGGLRFNMNRKDPMNLRIDFGFGENTGGFYLTIGEAF